MSSFSIVYLYLHYQRPCRSPPNCCKAGSSTVLTMILGVATRFTQRLAPPVDWVYDNFHSVVDEPVEHVAS